MNRDGTHRSAGHTCDYTSGGYHPQIHTLKTGIVPGNHGHVLAVAAHESCQNECSVESQTYNNVARSAHD